MTDYGRNGPFPTGARLLEQYEVVRLLGTGGHAYVYECRDLFLDEHLAVKVIPNPPNRGRDLLNRARAEAQLLRRLSHPNVVRMHTAAALGEDMVCLVMEKLDGVSLRHLLAVHGRLSIVEAATIVRQIAIGVAAAHELNVVHRDIKPDNAFVLPPNNHVKVLDFGIAKFLGHGLQTSNKYRFQGTPLYMSPEHLKGAGVTVRSDVYQLGTVFFELIAGINPNLIDLDNPGFEQVAFVQITRPTPSLQRVIPTLLDTLDQLIQKATAKDPTARFATMVEFVAALDQTMHAHVAAHPEELHHVRYVDPALMQAVKELAEREDSQAWDGQADAHQTARRRVDSTSPMDTAPTEPLNALPQTDKVASYHPVPQMLEQGAIAIPKLRQPRTLQPKAPVQKLRSISVLFVLGAIGFGVAVGLILLWLVPRNYAAARTASSVEWNKATALETSPVTESSPPISPSTLPTTHLAAPAIQVIASRAISTRAATGVTTPESVPKTPSAVVPPAPAAAPSLPAPEVAPPLEPPAEAEQPTGEGKRPRQLTGGLNRPEEL